MPTSTTYLTTRDVQDLIRVDKSTIYRMAESGTLPAVKVGRQWRFPADEIEQWLNGRDQAPTGSPEVTTQDIADLFADLYGVMVVVTDIDGEPLTRVSNPCGYFQAVAGDERAVERCIAEWKTLGGQFDLEPRLLATHLGFLCTRSYIRSGNELTGMVIAGGIEPESWPPTETEIHTLATEARVADEVVAGHAHEVYRLDETQRTALPTAVSRLAGHLSRIASRGRSTPSDSEPTTNE